MFVKQTPYLTIRLYSGKPCDIPLPVYSFLNSHLYHRTGAATETVSPESWAAVLTSLTSG